MDPLRIVHAAGYAPAWRMHLVRKAERLNADSIAPTEAFKVAPFLLERPKYQGIVARSEVDTRAVRSAMGDAGDNPLMVHNRNRVTGHRALKITDPGEPRKFAPERWGYRVTYRKPGWARKVTHVSIHPDPMFCGRLRWLAVVRWALAEVVAAKRKGHHVVLTGDLQTRGRLLLGLLRAAGLVVHREGIDYVCHNRRLRLLGDLQVIQQEQFDHPWLLADFEPVDR